MSSTSPKLSAVGKLSIGAESSVGVAASMGNTAYVKCVSADVSGLTVNAMEDAHVKQRDYNTPRIIGPRTGEITTSHYMSGYSSDGASIAAAPPFAAPLVDGGAGSIDGFQMLISALGSALGGAMAGGFANDVDTATSTTDAINCTAGTGSTPFTVGQGVSWIDANGVGHVGYAKQVTAGTVSLLQVAKTGAEVRNEAGGGADDGRLYGSYTCYQATGDAYHDNTTACKSYTIYWQGLDSDDSITAVGCYPTSFSISAAVGEMPLISITWGVSHWTESGSGGLGGGAAVEAWPHPLCEPFSSGGWVPHGATQHNPMRISSLDVDLQMNRPPIKDASFSSGVGGFGPVTRAPKVSFTVFRDFSEEVTDFLNQQDTYDSSSIYSFTFGSQPGKMCNILVPNGRIESYPARGDEDGAVTSTVDVLACHYDGDTGATPTDQSTPIDSDFRISFS